MSYRPDEYDLERSHELERRLDRDFEREPFRGRYRRAARRRPRYFSGLLFRPVSNANAPIDDVKEAA
ncbi:MAG TPA: hypothetical protein VFQ53_41120 [Kofleriaceae bacterium]|nr:hypothetical protein [Kofleriaceae bacterium]